MAWDNLTSNQPVNGINLRDAVSKGLFTVKSGQTIPDNDECLTKDETYSLVNIQQVSSNKLINKSEIIASSVQWSATSFGELDTVCGLPLTNVLYSNSNVLNESTYFYSDEARTQPYGAIFAVQYGNDKVKIQTFTNGRIKSQEVCINRVPVAISNVYTNLGTNVCGDTNRGVWYVNSNDYPIRVGSVFYPSVNAVDPISSTIKTKLLDLNQWVIITTGTVTSIGFC